jgi:iron complex outermembrane receptor protein
MAKRRIFSKMGLQRLYAGLLPLCFFSVVAQGQNCHLHLYGYVRDSSTAVPLSFASILIRETGQGALADEQGYFHVEGLCPGEYTLQATRVGCSDKTERLTVRVDTGVSIYLQQTSLELGRVEVSATRAAQVSAQASNTLGGIGLDAGKALGLAESLKRIPGVSSLNTGATISKPVIQGLHSNRILILNNGVRQEGQQWGSEHAPEVDPFTAQEATVIKGAGSVRYGSDALGGVILLKPAAIRSAAGLGGEINLQGMGNGRGGAASGMLEFRPAGAKLPIAARIQGTLKRSGNLRTPDYFLHNTGVLERNFSWTLRTDRPNWESEVYYSRFYTQLGILRDAHIGNLSDLKEAIERGRPLQDGAFSYQLARPQQRALHELVRWRTKMRVGESSYLEWQLSRQFNRRQEYDAHRRFNALPAALDEPQIALEITTHRIEADLEHHWMKHLSGHIGVNAMAQRNTTDRGALLPDYENSAVGAYWIERWKNYPQPLELELGLRYDLQRLSAGPFERDTSIKIRSFRNISGSLGAVYALSARARLRAHSGLAWRAPHVSELYSSGVHHGSASYEQGNPYLGPERAWNNSLTLEWASEEDRHTLFLSVFYNRIDDYIYLQPMAAPVLTIRGAFPGFAYAQADARLRGFDARYALHPGARWMAEVQASVVQGWNRARKEYLVFMPPVQLRYHLRYSLNLEAKPCPERFLQISAVQALQQSWAPEGQDYAAPPAGYMRIDAEAAYSLHLGRQHIELGLSVINLLNAEYREYLNRLRYFAAEPGRNVLLRIRLPF